MSFDWLPWRRRPAPPSGLTCRELVELVTEYFEGVLDRGERARFESHIEHCSHCATYVEQLRVTVRLTGALEPEALSPEAEDALLDAFRSWKAQGGRA